MLSIDLKAGPSISFFDEEHGFEVTPQIAIWVEDEAGRYGRHSFVDRILVEVRKPSPG